MNDTDITLVKNKAGKPRAQENRPIFFDLRLRSLKSSRQTLARILREWGRGNLQEKQARAAVYFLNVYLAFLKAGIEEQTELRLQKIEGQMKAFQEEQQRRYSHD